MALLPTGTVTFLFTDIEGSTRLLQQLREHYAELLNECHRILHNTIEERSGHVISLQGDGLFAVFHRARDGLVAAVTAQQAITAHPGLRNAGVRVRMGLHTGEARLEATGYVGIDVHCAARIGAAGYGGQILASEATYGLIARNLPEGMTLRFLGQISLKDFEQAQRVYQVVAIGLPVDFPPLRFQDTPSSNLPRELTSFIDREKETAEVKQLLSTARLVTLTGTGGAGKTRLAFRVAADEVPQYADGVWLVELAALSDPALVPTTVAFALGVREEPSRPQIETLVNFARTRALLIVLDNCEHMLAACAELADSLVRACPNLRVLATSREPFNISGEVVFRVPPLALPDPRHSQSLEYVAQCDSVRLFVERAMLAQPEFGVRENNAAALTQVCTMLDGIPLAIELAAARLKVLTVQQIADRLIDRFRLLTTGDRTRLPHHRTLQATMDWSHAMLTERERALFRRLSVFVGGWTLAAAEDICAIQGVEGPDVLDILAQLVDKSLVVITDEHRADERRYQFLETVRQYAWGRLVEADEEVVVRERHRDFFLGLAERANPELWGPAQTIWLERVDADHDNFRSAIQWCVTSGGGEHGRRLACALWWFWYVRGHHREGRERLETVLRIGTASPILRATALRGVGYLASNLADFSAARDSFEEALTVSRNLKDAAGAADALYGLGRIAFRQKDLEQARVIFNEARRLFEAAGDKRNLGRALNSLGYLAATERDFATARARYAESIAIGRELGSKWLLGYATGNLGVVAFHEGDYDTARAFHKEALALWSELGDKIGMISGLEDFALLAAAQGQGKRAAHLLGAAEAALEAFGRRLPVDSVNSNLDDYVARLRAEMGEEVWIARLAEGRAMTLAQAAAYALTDDNA